MIRQQRCTIGCPTHGKELASGRFLGFMQLARRRYVLGDEIQQVVQLFKVSIAEARKNHGFVDLGELIQHIQNGLRCRRQKYAVGSAIVGVWLPLEIPFGTQAIDRSADRNFPHLQQLGQDSLSCARSASNRGNESPFGARQAARFDFVIEILAQLAGYHRQFQ